MPPTPPSGQPPRNPPPTVAAHVRAAMAVAQAKPAAPVQAKGGAPARHPPPPAPRILPLPARAIQRALDFDSNVNGQWIPDRKNCQLCKIEIGWNKRHHCRVCGRSVCSVCAGEQYQVTHKIEKRGRSASARPSTERVCVDCVIKRKLALAAGVPELANLQLAARAGAGNRAIALDWDRFEGEAKYNPGFAMVILDPRANDSFSNYLFELTNAAQAGRLRQPTDFDDPEKYAFFVELLEYNGTRTHQRVARAINNQNLGFRVREKFPVNLPDLDSFNRHYQVQQDEHTERYRKQWREAHPEQARRGSFSKAPEKPPARRRDSL